MGFFINELVVCIPIIHKSSSNGLYLILGCEEDSECPNAEWTCGSDRICRGILYLHISLKGEHMNLQSIHILGHSTFSNLK